MEETTYIEEVEQQEPDQQPEPKPKKVKVKEFAAKIKAKYPDYKDVDDLELTQKIIAKYPEYKDQVDFTPETKKKSSSIVFEESSLQAGNALSQSNGVGGEEIPTIELYTTPNGEVIQDPFVQSKKYHDLSNATTEVSVPSSGKGGQLLTSVPDEFKRKEAKALREELEKAGIDPDALYNDTKDIPDDILNPAKEELIRDRVENPNVYQRKIARLKWKPELDREVDKLVDSGGLNPEQADEIKFSVQSSLDNSEVGTFEQQRQNANSVANAIKQFGGVNTDKILANYATEISKVYGNSYKNGGVKVEENSPEATYLNTDAQLGYQYLKDLNPKQAGQYQRLFVDPKTLKDNPDAERGYNHLMQVLEETGIGLVQNAVTEDWVDLNNKKEIQGGLTPEQLSQKEVLEKKNEELTQKRNELDKKYPDRIENKVDDAVREILGDQKLSWGEYAIGRTFEAGENTVEGLWEMVSTPFMSDASNTIRELAIMGDTLEADKLFKTLDKNKSLQTDALSFDADLQTQIDAIKNNGVSTTEQKRKQLYDLLKNNTDKFGRVPIQGGKINVSPASILYGVTDIATTLAPFIAIEAATGGIGGTGAAAKFLRTFNAAAVTTFHDHYAQALMNGASKEDAYKEAMGTTAITSMAMAGAGTPDAIRAMAGTKTSAGKIISQMSDDTIQKVLSKGTPKGFQKIKGVIKERVKATPELLGKGFEGGAKFELAMNLGEEAKGAIYGTEIDREHGVKRMALGILNFGILGAGLGHLNYKSPTELQKSAFLETGKNPKEYISIAEQMVKDGELTPQEFEQRKNWIEKSTDAYKSLPTNLNEVQKAEYHYLTVVKNEANKGKSDLPPKQAAEAEKTALVADYERGLILKPLTEKQLESTKSSLEKKLEMKDKEGELVLKDKERKEVEAELQAIENTIENNKIKVPEPPKIQGEPEKISKPVELVTEVEGKPEEISQPIELSVEEKTALPKNNYKETYDKALNNPETRELALEEISGQWHDPRSRKLIEESIAPEIIEEAKQKFPKQETTLNIETETTEVPKSTEAESPTDIGVTETPLQAESGKTGGKEPPQEPNKPVEGEGDNAGITHAANEVRRMDRQLPEYEKTPESFEQWNTEAEKKIKDGYDVEKLMDEIQAGKDPNPVENAIRKIYIATLDAQIEKTPTDALLAKQKRFIEIGDLANSRAGKNLVSLKGQGNPLSTISDFYVAKMEAIGADKLTDAQKAEVQKQYEQVQKTSQDAALKIEKLEAENAKLRAEAELRKAKSTTKKEKKDFVKERADIKKNILDKWNKSKNVGFAADPSKDLLMDIAPDVAKLVKSYIQEGVVKLEEIVSKIHEDIKGYIPSITEKNINDIIAGVYDAPKETRGDLLAKLKSIKDKKSEEAIKIKARIKTGDFAPPKKTVTWVNNPELKNKYPKEYKAALDALVAKEDARHEFDLAIYKDQMKNRSKAEKVGDFFAAGANTTKKVVTGIDDSAIGIQTLAAMAARPVVGAKALKLHALDAFSQKRFERGLAELHNSPDFDLMKKSGLDITEPKSLSAEKKEEAFGGETWDIKFKLNGKEYKVLGSMLKPFERAFTSLGNGMRVIAFRTIAEKLTQEGYTFEKNPQVFKDLALMLNTETGRGKQNEYIQKASELVTAGIWSPKLMASRLNMLGITDALSFFPGVSKAGTKGYYRKLDPRIRKEAVKDLVKFTTTVMAMSYLVAWATGGTVDTDPDSQTFLDIKDGDKSYNLSGGFSQYMRLVAQTIKGGKKSNGEFKEFDVNKDKSRGSNILHFMRGKLTPMSGVGVDLLTGKDFAGNPIELGTEVKKLTIPLSMQNVVSGIEKDGYSSLFTTTLPNFVGINVKDKRDFIKQDLTMPEWRFLEQKNLRLVDHKKETLKPLTEDGKPVEVTEEKYQQFIKKREDIVKQEIKDLMNEGAKYEDEEGEVIEIPASKVKEIEPEEIKKWLMNTTKKATEKAIEEIWGEQPKVPKKSTLKTNKDEE